jgi:hypothetical protein
MRKAWLLAALAAPLCGSAQAQMPPLTTWVWQLSGSVRQTYAAKVYDIDMEDTSSGVIGQLKSQGHTVICYFSAGTWEDWRSDASAFPASVKGKAVSGWAGENLARHPQPVTTPPRGAGTWTISCRRAPRSPAWQAAQGSACL